VPSEEAIGLEEVGARPAPRGIEVTAVAGGDAQEHGVRLAFADRVAPLVPTHDPSARLLVTVEEEESRGEGLVGGPTRCGNRWRRLRRPLATGVPKAGRRRRSARCADAERNSAGENAQSREREEGDPGNVRRVAMV
jgi:hypothetical protein